MNVAAARQRPAVTRSGRNFHHTTQAAFCQAKIEIFYEKIFIPKPP
jgi:hypothetical protein